MLLQNHCINIYQHMWCDLIRVITIHFSGCLQYIYKIRMGFASSAVRQVHPQKSAAPLGPTRRSRTTVKIDWSKADYVKTIDFVTSGSDDHSSHIQLNCWYDSVVVSEEYMYVMYGPENSMCNQYAIVNQLFSFAGLRQRSLRDGVWGSFSVRPSSVWRQLLSKSLRLLEFLA